MVLLSLFPIHILHLPTCTQLGHSLFQVVFELYKTKISQDNCQIGQLEILSMLKTGFVNTKDLSSRFMFNKAWEGKTDEKIIPLMRQIQTIIQSFTGATFINSSGQWASWVYSKGWYCFASLGLRRRCYKSAFSCSVH